MSQNSISGVGFSTPQYTTLEVGPTKERFSLHEDLLLSVSIKFKELVESAAEEGTNHTISLLDTSAEVFKIFLDWLYFRRIPGGSYLIHAEDSCFYCDGKCETPITDLDTAFERIPTHSSQHDPPLPHHSRTLGLTALYIFAHKYDIQPLRESIVDQEWAACYLKGDIFSYQDLILAHKQLPSSSPLLRLMVDCFVSFWSPDFHMRCAMDVALFRKLPQALIFRSMSLLVAKRDDETFMKNLNVPCTYHEHDDTAVARDACGVKHESHRKRKLEELDRASKIYDAIVKSTGGRQLSQGI